MRPPLPHAAWERQTRRCVYLFMYAAFFHHFIGFLIAVKDDVSKHAVFVALLVVSMAVMSQVLTLIAPKMRSHTF